MCSTYNTHSEYAIPSTAYKSRGSSLPARGMGCGSHRRHDLFGNVVPLDTQLGYITNGRISRLCQELGNIMQFEIIITTMMTPIFTKLTLIRTELNVIHQLDLCCGPPPFAVLLFRGHKSFAGRYNP